ncbi:hypothetical protein BKA80DRAFT_271188 [Phyllosticta citrichinensis]
MMLHVWLVASFWFQGGTTSIRIAMQTQGPVKVMDEEEERQSEVGLGLARKKLVVEPKACRRGTNPCVEGVDGEWLKWGRRRQR